MKGFLTFLGVILAGLVVIWFLMTFVLVSDEDQIRRVIERGRSSIVGGSVLPFTGILSADYTHEGRVDRRSVIGGLRQLFQQTENRSVLFTRIDVSIEGERATAEIDFVFDADITGPASQALRELETRNDETRTLWLTLEKDGRSWEIIRSDT